MGKQTGTPRQENVIQHYKEMSSNAMKTRGNFKCILSSERSHSEKATFCMIPSTRHSGKGKTMEAVRRAVVARGVGEEGKEKQVEHRGVLQL